MVSNTYTLNYSYGNGIVVPGTGILLNNDVELTIDTSNIHQINEVRDIQWFTKEESYKKIRNYNKTKYEIIDKVFHFANEYTKDLQLY